MAAIFENLNYSTHRQFDSRSVIYAPKLGVSYNFKPQPLILQAYSLFALFFEILQYVHSTFYVCVCLSLNDQITHERLHKWTPNSTKICIFVAERAVDNNTGDVNKLKRSVNFFNCLSFLVTGARASNKISLDRKCSLLFCWAIRNRVSIQIKNASYGLKMAAILKISKNAHFDSRYKISPQMIPERTFLMLMA